MMRTPSLRLRVVVVGFAVGAGMVVALSTFVYVSLRAELVEGVDEVLAARVELARELGATLPPAVLADRLAEAGVPAIVVAADGTVLGTGQALDGVPGGPPAAPGPGSPPVLQADVELPEGGTVTVMASRAGVDRTLRRVLLLETAGTAVVLAVLLVVLFRASSVVLGPLHHVVLTARRIAAGQTGERLHPDRPETELGQMAAAFDEMLDALERSLEGTRAAVEEARASEARARRFLADAAHQLRTPVAAVRAAAEGLMHTEDPAERERLLDHVAAESARTGRLVRSLMRLAALDAAATTGETTAPDTAAPGPARRATDAVGLVAREVERAAGLAPQLHVDLRAPAGEVVVDVDPEAIREAVANLLDNARRHASSRIVVRVVRARGCLEVCVEDDGPGLPPGAEEAVFDRFRTFSPAGGAGLGLPIARGIARAHGGDVVHRDGAFLITLPLAQQPASTRA